MKLKTRKLHIYFYIIISFLIFSIISSFIIMHIHILVGTQDIIFHSKMAMELKDSIEHGNYLPSFSFNYFHGSSIMSMYPYLDILPFSVIFCFTSSIIHAYSYFFMLITFVSCLISYYSSLTFSRSRRISYIFSFVYSLSSTFIFEVFSIGGLGVATAMSFAPLAVFGFIDILNGSKNYVKLSFGLFLMSLCELPAVIVTSFILFVWFLCNWKQWTGLILLCIKSVILFILLTSIIWIPMFNVLLRNDDNTIIIQGLKSVSLKDFFLNISILAVISLIIFILKEFRVVMFHLSLNNKQKMLSQMGILSLVTLVLTSKIIPWKFIASYKPLNFLNQIQYTSRFLLVPQLLLCYLFSVFFYEFFYHSKRRIFYISLTGLVLVTIILQLLTQFYVYHKDTKYSYLNNVPYRVMRDSHINGHILIKHKWNNRLINGFLNNNDYYPKASNNRYKNINNNIGYFSNGHELKLRHIGYNRFNFNNCKDSKHAVLPLLYYKGEKLHIYVNRHFHRFHVTQNKLIMLNNIKRGKQNIDIQYFTPYYLTILKCLLFLSGIIWMILFEIKSVINKNKVINNEKDRFSDSML